MSHVISTTVLCSVIIIVPIILIICYIRDKKSQYNGPRIGLNKVATVWSYILGFIFYIAMFCCCVPAWVDVNSFAQYAVVYYILISVFFLFFLMFTSIGLSGRAEFAVIEDDCIILVSTLGKRTVNYSDIAIYDGTGYKSDDYMGTSKFRCYDKNGKRLLTITGDDIQFEIFKAKMAEKGIPAEHYPTPEMQNNPVYQKDFNKSNRNGYFIVCLFMAGIYFGMFGFMHGTQVPIREFENYSISGEIESCEKQGKNTLVFTIVNDPNTYCKSFWAYGVNQSTLSPGTYVDLTIAYTKDNETYISGLIIDGKEYISPERSEIKYNDNRKAGIALEYVFLIIGCCSVIAGIVVIIRFKIKYDV